MSGFVAIKAVTLGGVTYQEGAAIPEEAVVPKRVPALVRLKCIARVGEVEVTTPAPDGAPSPQGEGRVSVPIQQENGVLVLDMAPEEVSAAIELVQQKAEDAIAALSGVTCGDVLILVDTLDQRKTVKAAAKERALKLEEERKAAGENPKDTSSDQAGPPPYQGDGKTDDAGEGTGDGGDQ